LIENKFQLKIQITACIMQNLSTKSFVILFR